MNGTRVILLMTEIPHDLIYQNCSTTINSRGLDRRDFVMAGAGPTLLAPPTDEKLGASDDDTYGCILLKDISVKFDDGTVVTLDALSSASLMAASPVFYKMLIHNMKEKECSAIELPGKDPKQLETLFKFLQPAVGRRQKLSDENVGFLRRLCEEYMIDALHEECVEFIREAEPSTKLLVAAHALSHG